MAKVKENNKKRFMNGFSLLCSTKSKYKVWADLMEIFAISIANCAIVPLKYNTFFNDVWEEREKKYIDIINNYSKKEQKLFPQMFALLVNEFEENSDQDLLGEIYMLLGISSNDKGQFFTPYDVCNVMSKITFNRKEIGKIIHKKGFASVYDCACGAGATLINAANICKNELFKKMNYQDHMYFVGQDIDITCVHMCYIQLSLLGLAGYVICGNTFVSPEPDLKNSPCSVWFTPIWFNDVWTLRRFMHGYDILMNNKMKG